MRLFKYSVLFLIILIQSSLCQSQPCTSSLNGGITTTNVANACFNQSFSLTVTGSTTGTGLTYQWERSLDNIQWTSISLGTSASRIQSQTISTWYRRRMTCNAGGVVYSTSLFIGMALFSDCYCIPRATSCSNGHLITNVQLSTLNNSSACGTNGYSNFTNSVSAVDLPIRSFQQLSVSVTTPATNRFLEYFIDFNQNGIFDSEESFTINSFSGNTYHTFIKIPYDAKIGFTRLRIIFSSSTSSRGCNSTAPPTTETEDYLVNVTPNPTISGTPIYVKANAVGINSGESWANAFISLNSALAIANPGDTIKVARGIYYPGISTDPKGFVLKDSIIILGGYPNVGNPNDLNRNFSQNQTILSGFYSSTNGNRHEHVLFASGTMNNLQIDGFIIENGGTTPNRQFTTPSNYSGGGILIEKGANITLRNCVWRKNYNSYTFPDSSNLQYTGTAIAITQSSPKFYNSIIEEQNSGGTSLAIYKASNPEFYNFLIVKGKNEMKSAIMVDSSNPVFRNSTIARNETDNVLIRVFRNSQVSFHNSIIFYNPRKSIFSNFSQDDSSEVKLDITSSILLNNTKTQVYADGTNYKAGLLERFIDTSSVVGADGLYFTQDDGFSLKNPCSQSINVGNNLTAGVSTDITGNPRIVGGTIDLGAYEVQQAVLPIPKVIYVNATATGLNNGSSWSNAFTNFNDAMQSCSDTIKIAAGNYSLPPSMGRPDSLNNIFRMENNRVILGAYPNLGSPTNEDRNYDLYKTKIGGISSIQRHNTTFVGYRLDSTAIIDGLVFAAGSMHAQNSNFGYFLQYKNCNNPIISNCTFRETQAGSFYAFNCNNILLRNCFFENNFPYFSNSYYFYPNNPVIVLDNCNKTSFKKCVVRNNCVEFNKYPGSSSHVFESKFSNPVFDSCSFERNQGTVVRASKGNPLFNNCKFLLNYNSVVHNFNFIDANAIINNCTFIDSFANTNDYSITTSNSNASFIKCNFSYQKRGGVSYTTVRSAFTKNQNSLLSFTNCIIENFVNLFDNDSTNLSLKNCLVTDIDSRLSRNTRRSVLNIFNSTIAKNFSATITNDINSVTNISNSIFWKNYEATPYISSTNSDVIDVTPGNTTINNSIIEQGNIVNGTSNLKGVDPRFVNFENPIGPDSIWFTADDGFRLCDCSPAINSANNSFYTEPFDIAGNSRIFNTTMDRGAYEMQFIPITGTGKTSYVNALANGNNSGVSWSNAYKSLQSAFKNQCTDTIKIASGVYKPSVSDRDSLFYINRNLVLLGSYNPTNPSETERDVDINPTILSGDIGVINDSTDNSFGLVKAYFFDSLKVDGIQFKQSNSFGFSSPSIWQNYTGPITSPGAFVAHVLQNVEIKNCRFYQNRSGNGGGAFISTTNNFEISNSVFNENYASGSGGGLTIGRVRNASLISNCIFNKNEAYFDGGAFSDRGYSSFNPQSTASGKFVNCIMNSNIATRGGGAFILVAGASFTNCTFSNNRIRDTFYRYGAGIRASPIVLVTNSIFTNNFPIGQLTQQGPCQDIIDEQTTMPQFGNIRSYLGFNATSTGSTHPLSIGNITSNNIQYLNESNPIGLDGKWFTTDDGLQLSLCSSGIDAASNTSVSNLTNTDIIGRNRIFNNVVDMGAYEFSGTPQWMKILNTPNDSLTANKEYTDAEGWTHYFKDCSYLMSIKKNGQNIGTVGNGTFSVKIVTTPNYGSGFGTNLSSANYVSPGVSWKVMNRYWKVTPTTQPIDSIFVRFPYTNTDFNDVKGSNPAISAHQQMVFYKVDGPYNPMDLNVPISAFHQYFYANQPSKKLWSYSQTDTIHNAQYFIQSFSGGGGGGGTGFNGGALPVTIVSLKADVIRNSYISINWKVQNQINILKYVVEKSINGRDFKSIGTLQANNTLQYFFDDKDVVKNTIYYYRIKPVGNDGKESYSFVVTAKVNTNVNPEISILPNPTNGLFYIKASGFNTNEKVCLEIVTVDGKICHQQDFILSNNLIQHINATKLPRGVYNVIISSISMRTNTKLLIVN